MGYNLHKLKKAKFASFLKPDSYRAIGGRFKRLLTTTQLFQYLELMVAVTRNDPNSDHHIGDSNFQAKIIGSVSTYVQSVVTYSQIGI
jgi:hypothetical protein